MTQSTSNDKQGPEDRKSEAEVAKENAGKDTDKSSNDHMSRQKAGEQGGAGGGAKQEQKH
ncbi:MAG: hypothetical protein WKG03_06200 [Telluria sp.]